MTNKLPLTSSEQQSEQLSEQIPEPAPEPIPTRTPESRRRRQLRSLFWPGFVVGFLLLGMVSCGGLVLATGINRLDLADLQNNEQAWSPPQVTATPVVTPAAEDTIVGETGGAFNLGEQYRNITSSQVNIRAEPGYLSKPAGDVIGQIPPGGVVEITGGYTVADGLTWWLIRYTASDGAVIDGWIAEATASGVQILGR